jgi:hypothetical protein
MRRIFVVLALLALPLGAQDSKGPYEAPDREPTPEETLIVELMNRFRANPSAEADLIAPPGKSGGSVDWKMFRDEMKQLKPMPPVVFNLDLLDAARKHSYYMIHNGLTHDEVAGKVGFYGASPGERIKLSGFKGGGWAENAFRMRPRLAPPSISTSNFSSSMGSSVRADLSSPLPLIVSV